MCAPFGGPEGGSYGQATFFVCQANTGMPCYLAEAEHHAVQLLTPAIKAVLADNADLASQAVDDEEEDDSNESAAEESDEENDTEDEDMVRLSLFYIFAIFTIYV